MPNWKTYASAGVFVLMTVLKLLLPDATEDLRQTIVRVIDMDMDYKGMAVQVGKILTEENVQEVLGYLHFGGVEVMAQRSPQPSAAPEEPSAATAEPEETPIPTPDSTVTPEPTPEVTPEPTPTPAPTQELTPAAQAPTSVQQAVAAFKTAQEAYSGYDTPEKVSYDNLIIPFSYTSPVNGVKSSGFGYRVHPIENMVRFHYGTDFAANEGTPIVAFADGEVTMTGFEKGYGNYVQITHANGWQTFYAHCSKVDVRWWQNVKEGETIAYVGSTGEATGSHLHFELLCNGLYTNPEFFF